MRSLRIIAVLLITFLAVSCQPKKKAMTMEDYVKIDMEMTTTDMMPESKEKVVKKYGYTLEQFDEFAKKVEADPKLIEKRGELMLKKQKTEKK
jgi:ABC-type metal ion transport system substrate-binding protein